MPAPTESKELEEPAAPQAETIEEPSQEEPEVEKAEVVEENEETKARQGICVPDQGLQVSHDRSEQTKTRHQKTWTRDQVTKAIWVCCGENALSLVYAARLCRPHSCQDTAVLISDPLSSEDCSGLSPNRVRQLHLAVLQ